MQFEWPESFEEDYEDYHLPKYLKNMLILSDTHIPYHSIRALDEAVEYGIKKKVDSILLNGDILDCYTLSKYLVDPTKRKFKEEIEDFKKFIQILQEAFPGKPIYYKMGNHEERYEKIMIDRCPEFLGVKQFEFGNILGLYEFGVVLIKDQKRVYYGKLPIFHGHEVGLKSVAVNPARSLFLKIHACGITSHLHRTSQHTEPSIESEISCWSTGHLGDPHPKFARNNKWNHGCARAVKDEAGDYEVININLKRNKLFFK